MNNYQKESPENQATLKEDLVKNENRSMRCSKSIGRFTKPEENQDNP